MMHGTRNVIRIRTVVSLEDSEDKESERCKADRPVQSGPDRMCDEVGYQGDEPAESIACTDRLQDNDD